MHAIFDWIRSRLPPAIVMAAGVTFVAAGLLTYMNPVAATHPSASPEPSPSAVAASPTALLTFPPLTGSAGPSASVPADRVATRIVIPALGIDLPVVKPPAGEKFPYCNVAEYLPDFGQPGEPRATYIYAHARTGMFLPLLDQSRIDNGSRMIGMLVQVYTNDDQLFLYAIMQVRRHRPIDSSSLDDAVAATTNELWIQTSEGPFTTSPKLQVVAQPLSSGPADPADAHPTPHPIVCG